MEESVSSFLYGGTIPEEVGPIPRGPKDPSLLVSFGTHVVVAI